MSVSIKDVERIAELAMLKLTDEEKEKYATQLNHILDYMATLNKLDTSDVEPFSHATELTNVFRPDELQPSISTEDALKNAPSRTEQYFKVPKVIDDRQ